jgi:hypothetical protein
MVLAVFLAVLNIVFFISSLSRSIVEVCLFVLDTTI